MKTNNIFVKLLVCILIVLTLVNFIGSIDVDMNYSFASSEASEERANDLLGGVFSGIVGAIANFFKSIILAPFRAARSIAYDLASAGGTTNDMNKGEITPFDIFFNRVTLLDANLFSTTNRDGKDLDHDSIVYQIRVNTAIWYYAIRALAIAVVALMLLWNLIRSVSKNTSAEQKTVAKNSLTDWVLSFALIMFMHIIVIVVLNFNDVILQAIQNFIPEIANTSQFLDALENAVFAQNLVLGIAALVVYALMIGQTFQYIFKYIQRLLTIVLLIMISPLVPVTYSTDRMRGGRGAALNGWLKELIFNVFVQSLHAIVYASLVSVSMSAITAQSVTGMADLGPALIAVASMLFVQYAEKMVKTIFGFNNSSVINNNVFSDTFSSISNTARSIGRAGQRVATGGPLISFGTNVDGSHIGIGQVVQGLGNSAGQAIANAPGVLRGTGEAFRNGLNSANIAVYGGISSEAGGARSSNSGENQSSSGENAAMNNGEKAKGTTGTNGAATIYGGEAPNLTKEQEQQIQSAISQSVHKEEVDNRNENEKKKTSKEVNKEEENITNISTKEQIREESTQESEIVINEGSKGEIIVGAYGNINQDLLDKFKTEFKAILNNDKSTLEQWAEEVQKKMDALENKLSTETKNNIIDTIQANWKDSDKVRDFINSFEKGTNERAYAESVAELGAYIDIDDEGKVSTAEKLEALINAYGAQGLKVTGDFTKLDESQLDKLSFGNNSSGDVENAKIDNIKTISLRQTMRDLSALDPKKFKIKGELEGQIQTQIEEDFTARLEEVTSKMGRTPRGLQDIYDNMDKKSQEQFKNYKNAQRRGRAFDVNSLDASARDLAIIEREARHLGFEMETAQRFELRFDDGTIKTTDSSKGAILSLEEQKRKLEQKKQKLA